MQKSRNFLFLLSRLSQEMSIILSLGWEIFERDLSKDRYNKKLATLNVALDVLPCEPSTYSYSHLKDEVTSLEHIYVYRTHIICAPSYIQGIYPFHQFTYLFLL